MFWGQSTSKPRQYLNFNQIILFFFREGVVFMMLIYQYFDTQLIGWKDFLIFNGDID